MPSNEYNDTVMIALLPKEAPWCKIELPHLTLVYGGKTFDAPIGFEGTIAKMGKTLSEGFYPQLVKVLWHSVFGETPDDLVDVFEVAISPDLRAMRKLVEPANRSEYTNFAPHVTVGPKGSYHMGDPMPETILFDRLHVLYGTKDTTYDL